MLESEARRRGVIRIWPFDGPLDELVQSGTAVLAETYPAEFYRHLGMSGNAKTKVGWRLNQAPHLVKAASELGLVLKADLQAEIGSGFGDRPDGEDRFDATAGLLGMLRVVGGLSPTAAPADATLLQAEGWILGRPSEAEAQTGDEGRRPRA